VGWTGRIPIVAFVGEEADFDEPVRRAAETLSGMGHRVGVSSRNELRIDGLRIAQPCSSARAAARILLADPLVTAVVLAASGDEVLTDWFEFDRCDLLVLDSATRRRMEAAAGSWSRRPSQLLAELAGQVMIDPSTAELQRCLQVDKFGSVRTSLRAEPAPA
jgi:hypothetical protein